MVAGLAAAGWAQAPPIARADSAKAQATLQAFERRLETHDSATAVLQAWCDAHGPTPGVKVVARPVPGAAKPLTALARRALRVTPGQAVRYRRVDLLCGDQVLSQADNWYLPAQLTDDMNRRLDQTRTPFGVAVKSLNFTRRNLETDVLLKGGIAVPRRVLRHAAVLLTDRDVPFSFVVENYTRVVLQADF
jgi:chorismate-pyruvate lyase